MSWFCFRDRKKKQKSNRTDGKKGGREFRPPRGYGGGAAGGGSGTGNGNLTVLTDDGGFALAATVGFAVAAAAVVDGGEFGGSCGGGECGGGGCGGGCGGG